MTAIPLHHSHTPARRHSRRYRLSDAAQHALATLHEWSRRAHERAELAALDDRMLKDIGVTRSEAVFLSGKPFWKE